MVQIEFCQPGFIVDGHRSAVIHRILNVVDRDIITEHRTGIFIFRGNRRAGKAHKRRIRQRIAHVFGVAVFVDASLSVQRGAQAILATVRFIRNHHDIAALVERRMALLSVQRRKLLHGGKDDAAGFTGIKQLAQFISIVGL